MRKKDDYKEKAIRKKAIQMIARHGLDKLSMQKLAKAANVSPATIYLYFKNREDLIIRLFLEVNERMLDATLKGFRSDMHFAEGLTVQWINRANAMMRNPVELQFLEQIRHSPFYDKALLLQERSFSEVMGEFMGNALRRKEIKKLPFEVYWSVAFAPLYQLVKYHQQGKSYVNKTFTLTDDIMKQALELVLKALKP